MSKSFIVKSPTPMPSYHERKDINGKLISLSFQEFLISTKIEGQGKILNIISDSSRGQQGLGGLGKTHETWNLLTDFAERQGLAGQLEVIDLSEERDRFGLLEAVVQNIGAQLATALPASVDDQSNNDAFLSFPSFSQVQWINQMEELVISNTLSESAKEAFAQDLELLKQTCKEKAKAGSPVVLFFDSLDWVVDEEILQQRKTMPPRGDWEKRLKEAQIKKNMLFYWLVEPNGLFRTLTEAGIYLVATGRYDLKVIAAKSDNNAIRDEISHTIILGDFLAEDLKAYIQANLPTEVLPKYLTDQFEQILQISQRKPVLAVVIGDLIVNQYRKQRPETLRKKLWDKIEEVNTNYEESDRAWELLKRLFEDLFEVTGSLQSAEAVKYMSLAFYRFSPRMLMELLSLPSIESAERICEATARLSLVKRYPHVKTGKRMEFLRPHDDLLVEFHQHWEKDDPDFKEFWYPRILEEFEKPETWKITKNDDSLRNGFELYYLTYLFEALQADKDLEKATRYTQFIFSENIDQNPDFADQILTRAEIYLSSINALPRLRDKINNMPRYNRWLGARRIEYELTTRQSGLKESVDGQLQKIYNDDYKNIKHDQQSMQAICEGYWGELNIWQSDFSTAEKYLDAAIQKIYLLKYPRPESQAMQSQEWRTQQLQHLEGRNLLSWLLHLKGFLYNRIADFTRSARFNAAAINASFPYLHDVAQKLADDYDPKRTLFSQNPGEVYRFYRMSRVFLRALGNLAAMRRYDGNLYGSINYCFAQVYLWHSMPNAIREVQRVLSSLLIASHTVESDIGIQNVENLRTFREDPLIPLRLSYANALSGYRQGGLSYINLYLRKDFKSKVKQNKGAGIDALQKALEEVNNGLTKGKIENPDAPVDNKKYPRELADLYYLKGKIHLSFWVNDQPDFVSAKTAFENAREVSKNCHFRYLEMESIESLMTLSWLNDAEDEFKRYKQAFEALEKEYPVYPDILAKYHNTLGNQHFSKAWSSMEDQRNEDEAIKAIHAAVQEYYKMLDMSLQHNQNRYDTALLVIATRISDIAINPISPLSSLIGESKKEFISGLDSTDAIKKDKYLQDFVKGLFQAVELLDGRIKGTHEKDAVRNLGMLQWELGKQDMTRKSIEINRMLIKYHRKKISQHDSSAESLKNAVIAYYRQSYLYQHINQVKKAQSTIQKAKIMLTEIGNESKEPLSFILDIGLATAQFRTSEFWAVERFISGEEKYYRNRYQDKAKEPVVNLRNAINQLALYCSSNRESEQTVYIRILAEGCFRLGEWYLLIGLPEEPEGREDEITKRAIDDEFALKAIETLFIEGKEEVTQMRNHIERGGNAWLEYARILSGQTHDIHRQAYSLQGIYNHWYLQKAKFGNEGVSEILEDKMHLAHTVKSYSLRFSTLVRLFNKGFEHGIQPEYLHFSGNENRKEKNLTLLREWYNQIIERLTTAKKTDKEWELWYKEQPNDQERFKIKETLSKYVRFLPDLQNHYFDRDEYESPFVYAKQKLVMGDVLFSLYFVPDDEIYHKITQQKEGNDYTGVLLLEKCKLTEEGKERIYAENSIEFVQDMRQMLLHYLEGLDMLISPLYEPFEFSNYLLEVQRRFLLIPERRAIEAIRNNLDSIWNQFTRLPQHPDLLQEIIWALESRYIGECISEIQKKTQS